MRWYGRVIFNSRKDMHAKRKHKLFCSGNSSSQILIIQKGYKTGITFNSLACAVLREYVGGELLEGEYTQCLCLCRFRGQVNLHKYKYILRYN